MQRSRSRPRCRPAPESGRARAWGRERAPGQAPALPSCRRPRAPGSSRRATCRGFWFPSASFLRWDLEFLARVDLVGMLEGLLVGFENPLPFLRAAVLALGDLRLAVARHHDIGLRGRGARAARHAAEVRHVVAHEILPLRRMSSSGLPLPSWSSNPDSPPVPDRCPPSRPPRSPPRPPPEPADEAPPLFCFAM